MCIARLLPDCNQSEIPQKIFIKVSNVKFHGTSINASRADTCRLSDGRTDVIKLIGERTYKLHIALSTLSFFPSSIVKPVQNH